MSNFETKNDNLGNNLDRVKTEWDDMENRSDGEKALTIGDKAFGDYVIASVGYDDKSEAYDDINNYRQGVDATTFFHNGKWYVVEKNLKEW